MVLQRHDEKHKHYGIGELKGRNPIAFSGTVTLAPFPDPTGLYLRRKNVAILRKSL